MSKWDEFIISSGTTTITEDFLNFINRIDMDKEDPLLVTKRILDLFIRELDRAKKINDMIACGQKYHLIKAKIHQIRFDVDRLMFVYSGIIHSIMSAAKLDKTTIIGSVIFHSTVVTHSKYFGIDHLESDTPLLKSCNYARFIHGKGDEGYAVKLFHQLVRIRELNMELARELKTVQDRAIAALRSQI